MTTPSNTHFRICYLLQLFIACILSYITVNAQSFNTTPLNWPTPTGGTFSSGGTPLGFNYTNEIGNNFANCESWSLIDMDGDYKSDLVVTASRTGAFYQQFGLGTSPYWKVYLNNGNGFNNSPVNWPTPTGGDISSGTPLGFIRTSANGSNETNSENWSTFDINNDNLPDLVVFSRYTVFTKEQFGVGSSPYWKVFLNTGTGFSTSPISWSTPTGGYYDGSGNLLGFTQLFSGICNNQQCQRWSTQDINGDDLPDLIIPSERSGFAHYQYNVGTTPYWKVYINTGSGFSTTPVNWSTPNGGAYSGTTFLGFNETSSTGCSFTGCISWALQDINGDDLADLVVPSEKNILQTQFGAGSNPYWKVYLNTGTGFSSSPFNWTTPTGGYYDGSGNSLGYIYLFSGICNNQQCQYWSTQDINGDDLPDLIVPGERTGFAHYQYNVGTTPYWKIHINTGTGFNNSPINWSTPSGGAYSGTTFLGFNETSSIGCSFTGCNSWSLEDINGDGLDDLIVTAEDSILMTQFGAGTNPYWKVYLNNGITSVNEATTNDRIRIYPNPSQTFIEVEHPYTSITQYMLTNSHGKVMLTGTFQNNNNKIHFNVSAGLYVLKLFTSDGIISKKISIVK